METGKYEAPKPLTQQRAKQWKQAGMHHGGGRTQQLTLSLFSTCPQGFVLPRLCIYSCVGTFDQSMLRIECPWFFLSCESLLKQINYTCRSTTILVDLPKLPKITPGFFPPLGTTNATTSFSSCLTTSMVFFVWSMSLISKLPKSKPATIA